MLKIHDLEAWQAYLAVATHGGFTEASRQLKTPLSQLSKRIAKLESELNIRLFQRTTRVVSLTDEGRALLPKIESIIDELKQAESLFESSKELTGTLRITSVPFVAHSLILPLLPEFMSLHPKVRLEFELSETFVNIIEQGLDMAIRIETPKNSDLVYRKIGQNDLVFSASPKYLKNTKFDLHSPSDLKLHNLLMLNIHEKCKFKNQQFMLKDFKKTQRIICENGAFLTELALNGFGVLVRSKWDVDKHYKNGTLTQVLKKHPLETFGNLYAVVPSKKYLAPRVRAFLDFLVTKAQNWD